MSSCDHWIGLIQISDLKRNKEVIDKNVDRIASSDSLCEAANLIRSDDRFGGVMLLIFISWQALFALAITLQ